MINFDFNKECYGCGACKNACKVGAITMEYNDEGFLVPVVDTEKCANCRMCDKVCPHLNQPKNCENKDDKVFAAYRKDTSKFKEYTSSGIFSALAMEVIKNGGYVCGCIWNTEMKAVHVVTNDENVVKKMCYSKYVQSNLSSCFTEMSEHLKNGAPVLFCGTPCQVASIKHYFGGKYKDSLMLIAIVCHGTPSPKVWEKYKESLEDDNKAKMTDANFRYKGKYGWLTPYARYTFDNGETVEKLGFTEDPYIIAFGADILHRNSCYQCEYKGTKSEADLVIGDYWGCSSTLLKKSKNKGISVMLIHTEQGFKMKNLISEHFEFEEVTPDQAIAGNRPVYYPVKYNPAREDFYKEFKENGDINYMYRVYNRRNYKIKRVLYKVSVFELLKRIKRRIQF